ncbi:MAG: DUF2975 domain-containing protein [bacterium]|nr:DUF2975 domain-containing protein [bacterium]
MEQSSTVFLKLVVSLIGIAVLAVCIFVLPYGINTDRTGMYAPILIGLYGPAIPFFVAIYQALLLLGYIEKNNVFSQISVKAIKNIKYCALVICALFIGGMPYIFYAADKDDAPGVVAIGFVIIGASFIIATAAAVLQKLLQNVVDMKAENDLTV